MSDDLHIPTALRSSVPVRSSYRARRPGMDRGTKYLLVAAVGLGGLLLAGVASWALIGDGHTVIVPVIEADSRPIRVKPENAGGLQVVGTDDQVMGGHGSSTRSMAPAAEVPAAQALRAQMPTQTAPPPPAAAEPVASPASPQVSPQASPQASPMTAQPAAIPAQAARAAQSPATGTLVQLAAVDSEEAAQSEWQRLAKRMPDLLGDRRPIVQRFDRDGRTVWRVRTGGFTDPADATAFCARVRVKGGACAIASF